MDICGTDLLFGNDTRRYCFCLFKISCILAVLWIQSVLSLKELMVRRPFYKRRDGRKYFPDLIQLFIENNQPVFIVALGQLGILYPVYHGI